MKIFITGATGGLGQKLIPLLNSEKYELVLLSIDPHNPFSQNNVTFIQGDLLAPEKYQEYIKDVDLIIHLAAITHTNNKALYYRVNTEGTKILIDLAEQYDVKRFIFFSTRAISESGGAYSDSKNKAEDIVRNSKIMWTIVRPAEIYGISEGEAITKLLKNIENMTFIPIIGDGSYKIAPVYVDDIINALIKIIDNNKTTKKFYTLAGPEEISYLDFVKKTLKFKNRKKTLIKIPIFLFFLLAKIIKFMMPNKPIIVEDQIPRLLCLKSADNSLAKEDFDYNPHFITQIIKSN
ncbi:MAG: NAD-dependent epimerase/dehydratase family protein [Candidatus Margulisbacteria bacterium]|nr:NAD-dependent epimerase/dehydratase family protein [Candidatus Margulisiibacteriota bacterium]